MIRSGAVAGAATAVGFAAVHEWLTSDIWYSLPIMLVAAAGCGVCLAWAYGHLFERPAPGTWAAWLAVQTVLLIAFAGASVLVFEPITTLQELLAEDGPPSELIAHALPFAALYTLAAAAVVSLFWGRSLRKFGAVLLTWTVLTLLFGLNASILGLVDTSGDREVVVVQFFALIAAIMVGYGVAVLALERKGAFGGSTA